MNHELRMNIERFVSKSEKEAETDRTIIGNEFCQITKNIHQMDGEPLRVNSHSPPSNLIGLYLPYSTSGGGDMQ